MKKNKIKGYAVINTEWQGYGWKDSMYQQLLPIRGIMDVFSYAIFNTKKEVVAFKNINKRKIDKIAEVEITIKKILR